MSKVYLPTALYGVRCDNLRVKKEYCEEQNFTQNDVYSFLEHFNDMLDYFGLVSFCGGVLQEEIYVGISPKYYWDELGPDFKTKTDADKAITDFIFECFDIKIPKEEFVKQFNYIRSVGW